MKIILDDGFFKIYPEKIMEMTLFSEYTGLTFMRYRDYFVPKQVYDLSRFNVKGESINGVVLENTTDNLEDLFKKNGLTFNFAKKNIVKIANVNNTNDVGIDMYGLGSFNLIEAGSYIKNVKVKSYFCRYNFKQFYYLGVSG